MYITVKEKSILQAVGLAKRLFVTDSRGKVVRSVRRSGCRVCVCSAAACVRALRSCCVLCVCTRAALMLSLHKKARASIFRYALWCSRRRVSAKTYDQDDHNTHHPAPVFVPLYSGAFSPAAVCPHLANRNQMMCTRPPPSKYSHSQQTQRGIASIFFLAFQAEPLQGTAPLASSSCPCCAPYQPQAGPVGHADWQKPMSAS
jgi:hypothetical protein